ncbi:MAG: hypothetical protein Q8P22_08990 [Chloroflexota bacterium]|nr:hypothetical protein [Chloroflexota bacterium]
MSTLQPGRIREEFESVRLPLWLEAFFGLEWLALHASPVYWGRGVPRSDGAPVITIPGFLGFDRYLVEMHYWLRRLGYRPYFSAIGYNAECPEVLTRRLFRTMNRAHRETGQKVHLIGHSLGGILARGAAVRRPDQVAQVISLASPFRAIRAHPAVLSAARFVRGRILGRPRRRFRLREDCYTAKCTCAFLDSLKEEIPPSVGRAAIFTKSDGIVDWRSCIEDDARLNIEVHASHVGLAFNREAYEKIAVLLASPQPDLPQAQDQRPAGIPIS